MKKSLIALAAFAAVASAQADVTIYGNLDPSVIVNKMQTTADSKTMPGGTSTSYATSSAQDKSSQLGFKGSEALGGGMKVIFDLQGDLTLGNGFMGNGNSGNSTVAAQNTGGNIAATANTLASPTADVFNRNAYVGLETSSGTLKIGRQFTPFHENQVNNDAYSSNSGGYLAAMSQLTTAGEFGINTKSNISNFGNSNTGVNTYGAYANGISFELPAMNGLTLKAFNTFGSNTGVKTTAAGQNLSFQAGGITSVKAVWEVTPAMKLNAAYQVTRAGQAPVPTVGGADPYSDAVYGVANGTTTSGTAPALSAVTPGTQVIATSQFGGQYTVGQFRFTIGQGRINQAIAGFDSVTVTSGGLLYSYSPTLDLGVEYTAVKDTTVTTNTANIMSATARYKLSKSTYFWALYGTTSNAGNAVMNSNYSGVGTTSATGGTTNSSVSSGLSYSF